MSAGIYLTIDGFNLGANNNKYLGAGTVSSYSFNRNNSVHFIIYEGSAISQLLIARNSGKMITRGVLVASDASARPTRFNEGKIYITTWTFLDLSVLNCAYQGALELTMSYGQLRKNNAFVVQPYDPNGSDDRVLFSDINRMNRLKLKQS